MGMGYAANFVDEIKEEDIAKIVPEQWAELQRVIKETISLEEYAKQICWQTDDVNEYVDKAVRELQEAFEAKTRLTISVDYHDPEVGDRYDDVSGVFWSIGGAYELTEAGKKYRDIIKRNFFVTFG